MSVRRASATAALGALLGGALLAVTALGARGEDARCRDYADGTKVAVIDAARVVEASGLAASDLQPGIFWTHNDSGAGPGLYALDEDGDEVARVWLAGADAVDWEDVALGPCAPGADTRACLYVADTGNNVGDRDDQVIYRIAEPDLSDLGRGGELEVEADAMFVALDASEDVEAMFIDEDAAPWLVSKDPKRARLYRVDGFHAGAVRAAERVAERGDIESVTGASASRDGVRVVLRSSDHAWELFRPAGRSLKSAFLGELLEIDLDRGKEKQGEAIAFAPDGSGFYTTREGRDAAIRWYRCKKFGASLSGKEDAGGIVSDPVTPSAGCGAARDGMGWALVVAMGVSVGWGRRARRRESVGRPGG